MIVEGVEVKEILGFPNYAVSRDGRVWSYLREIWLKPQDRGRGYYQVSLRKDSIWVHVYIHRLVLETYLGQCPDGMECRHLNGNPPDNRLENLTWGTHKENAHDSVLLRTHVGFRSGERSNRHVLTDAKVKVIRYLRSVAKSSLEDLAWQFDVTPTTISNVCRGKYWNYT